jgi:hypothetical protein
MKLMLGEDLFREVDKRELNQIGDTLDKAGTEARLHQQKEDDWLKQAWANVQMEEDRRLARAVEKAPIRLAKQQQNHGDNRVRTRPQQQQQQSWSDFAGNRFGRTNPHSRSVEIDTADLKEASSTVIYNPRKIRLSTDNSKAVYEESSPVRDRHHQRPSLSRAAGDVQQFALQLATDIARSVAIGDNKPSKISVPFKSVMMACDVKDNGFLNYTEAAAAILQLGFGDRVKDVILEEALSIVLDVFDIKQSGTIYYIELDAAFRFLGRLARFVTEKKSTFLQIMREYDSSDCGLLTRSYFERGLRKLGVGPQRRHMRLLMFILDTQQVNKVAYRNMPSFFKTFCSKEYLRLHHKRREKSDQLQKQDATTAAAVAANSRNKPPPVPVYSYLGHSKTLNRSSNPLKKVYNTRGVDLQILRQHHRIFTGPSFSRRLEADYDPDPGRTSSDWMEFHTLAKYAFGEAQVIALQELSNTSMDSALLKANSNSTEGNYYHSGDSRKDHRVLGSYGVRLARDELLTYLQLLGIHTTHTTSSGYWDGGEECDVSRVFFVRLPIVPINRLDYSVGEEQMCANDLRQVLETVLGRAVDDSGVSLVRTDMLQRINGPKNHARDVCLKGAINCWVPKLGPPTVQRRRSSKNGSYGGNGPQRSKKLKSFRYACPIHLWDVDDVCRYFKAFGEIDLSLIQEYKLDGMALLSASEESLQEAMGLEGSISVQRMTMHLNMLRRFAVWLTHHYPEQKDWVKSTTRRKKQRKGTKGKRFRSMEIAQHAMDKTGSDGSLDSSIVTSNNDDLPFSGDSSRDNRSYTEPEELGWDDDDHDIRLKPKGERGVQSLPDALEAFADDLSVIPAVAFADTADQVLRNQMEMLKRSQIMAGETKQDVEEARLSLDGLKTELSEAKMYIQQMNSSIRSSKGFGQQKHQEQQLEQRENELQRREQELQHTWKKSPRGVEESPRLLAAQAAALPLSPPKRPLYRPTREEETAAAAPPAVLANTNGTFKEEKQVNDGTDFASTIAATRLQAVQRGKHARRNIGKNHINQKRPTATCRENLVRTTVAAMLQKIREADEAIVVSRSSLFDTSDMLMQATGGESGENGRHLLGKEQLQCLESATRTMSKLKDAQDVLGILSQICVDTANAFKKAAVVDCNELDFLLNEVDKSLQNVVQLEAIAGDLCQELLHHAMGICEQTELDTLLEEEQNTSHHVQVGVRGLLSRTQEINTPKDVAQFKNPVMSKSYGVSPKAKGLSFDFVRTQHRHRQYSRSAEIRGKYHHWDDLPTTDAAAPRQMKRDSKTHTVLHTIRSSPAKEINPLVHAVIDSSVPNGRKPNKHSQIDIDITPSMYSSAAATVGQHYLHPSTKALGTYVKMVNMDEVVGLDLNGPAVEAQIQQPSLPQQRKKRQTKSRGQKPPLRNARNEENGSPAKVGSWTSETQRLASKANAATSKTKLPSAMFSHKKQLEAASRRHRDKMNSLDKQRNRIINRGKSRQHLEKGDVYVPDENTAKLLILEDKVEGLHKKLKTQQRMLKNKTKGGEKSSGTVKRGPNLTHAIVKSAYAVDPEQNENDTATANLEKTVATIAATKLQAALRGKHARQNA